jgi:peptide/nickel transport system ATP-binding protein
MTLLEVRELHVWFDLPDGGKLHAVRGVSFELDAGERVGLVGESGCGKTTTILAMLGLLPPSATVAGEVLLDGANVLAADEDQTRPHRWTDISMVFQGAMNALNPVKTVESQIVEPMALHGTAFGAEARAKAGELLELVGIPSAAGARYPHEFSGGMRQRAMIAMALACNPDVLIADEPTTALDVTIQAQIIELIDRLKDEFNSAVILITHDLGVVAEIADEIIVMYAGRVVERAATRQLFYDPQMPYTWGLLGSIPRLDRVKQERLHSIEGTPPSLIRLPVGCKFRPRCPYAFDKCMEEPDLANRVEEPKHLDRCWLSVPEKRKLREATLHGEEAAA